MCTDGFITIPGLSMNGHASIPVPLGLAAYQSEMCGIVFGVEGQDTTAALISKQRHRQYLGLYFVIFIASKQPFVLGVYTDTTTAEPGTGFNLEYTQVTSKQSRNKNSSSHCSFLVKHEELSGSWSNHSLARLDQEQT